MPRERLELDVGRAIAALGQLDSALRSSAANFARDLSRALQSGTAVKVTGDTSGLKRQVEGAVDDADTSVSPQVDDRSIKQARNQAQGLRSDFSEVAKAAAAIGLAVGAREVLRFIGESVMAASSLAEAVNQTRVTFGAASDEVEAFGEQAAGSVGLASDEALKAAGTFGNLFKSSGAGAQAAAEMSTRMVALAADLASFRDIDVEDALIRIQSGLVGEIEPLRRIGVLLNAATVEQRAMNDSGKATADQLTEQDKVMARYAIILEQTKDAQGDFARTSTGLANTLRTARAEIRESQVALGSQLAPEIRDAAAAFSEDMLPRLEEFAVSIARISAGAIPVLANSAGGLTTVLGTVGDILELLPAGVTEFATSALLMTKLLGHDAPASARAFAIGFAALLPILRQIDEEAANVAVQVGTLAAAGFQAGGPVGALVGGLIGLAGALGDSRSEAEKLSDQIDAVSRASDKAITKFAELTAAAVGGFGGEEIKRDLIPTLKEMARESDTGAGAARRLGEAYVAAGLITETQLGRALRAVKGEQDRVNETTKKGAEILGTQTPAAVATAVASYDALSASANANIPTLGSIFDQLGNDVRAAFGEKAVPSVSSFVNRLNASVFESQAWLNTMSSLFASGLDALATVVYQEGPGSALVGELNAANPLSLIAWNNQITTATGALQTIGGNAAALAQDAASKLPAALAGSAPAVQGAGTAVGQAGTTGLAAGSAGMSPAAVGAVNKAVGQVRGLGNPAYNAGALVGIQFAEGIAGGIASRLRIIIDAARNAVNLAEQAARDEAESQSPSKLFARVGADLVAGLAQGLAAPSPALNRAGGTAVSHVVATLDERRLGRAIARNTTGGAGAVQVIVVDSLAAARAQVPGGAQDHPVWLNR